MTSAKKNWRFLATLATLVLVLTGYRYKERQQCNSYTSVFDDKPVKVSSMSP